MKQVLVACSSNMPDSDFLRYGGPAAVARVLRRYGLRASSNDLRFLFVNSLRYDAPDHVQAHLLSHMLRLALSPRPPRFDAILLMGCNSVTWLLEHGKYSPSEARAILHDALAPDGLLLTFENSGASGGRIGVDDLETIVTARLARGVYINNANAPRSLATMFAPSHWAKLASGVYRKKPVPTAARRAPVSRYASIATGLRYAPAASAAEHRRRLRDF